MDSRAIPQLGGRCGGSIGIPDQLSLHRTRRCESRPADTDGNLQSRLITLMKMTRPKRSLVVLIGPSGSGKSTFARMHFKPTEVISSDFCRGLVSDNENSQEATSDAFDVLKYVVAKRLSNGLLTVIDAT